MFKKVLTALLVAGLVLSFAACDKKETPSGSGSDTPKAPTEQTGTGDTGTSSDSENIDYDAVLSKETYDGYNYRILVRKGNLNSQYF